MKIIGVTGPSGAGKGVCCEFLLKNGFPWIDTDQVYHSLIERPSSCVSELVSAFGKEIVNAVGGVDRSTLASIVFSDSTKRKVELLNSITHKFVYDETLRLLDVYKKTGAMAVVVDAPLLFEAGFDRMCDFCISVVAPPDVRLERIMARDGISRERAEARIAAQKTDDYYISRSKYTITNNLDKKSIEKQVSLILDAEGLIF